MYSPIRDNHHIDRQASKMKRKNQLAILLVNKFRNKLKIDPANEPELDMQVCEEIQQMVNRGESSEVALVRLDHKLTTLAKEMRGGPKKKSAIEVY